MAASPRRVLRIRASAPLLLRRASAPLPPLHGAALLRRLCTPSTATGGRLSGALDPSASEGAIVGADEGAFLQSESPTHARFVNMMMMHGKKQIARNILRGAFEMLSSAGHDPQHVFLAALDNARPALEMRTMARLQVPYPLNPRRAEMYAMKWIIGAARGRKMKGGMKAKLYHELLQAADLKGAAVGKRDAVHNLAMANQAAAHFRWRASSDKAVGAVDMDRKAFRPVGVRSNRRYAGPLRH